MHAPRTSDADRRATRGVEDSAKRISRLLVRAVGLAVLAAGTVWLVSDWSGAQPPPPADKLETQRFGVPLNLRLYPQDTPKAALQSLLNAVEKKQYAYLAAHLLDPAVVEARLDDRLVLFLDVAEKELQQEWLRQKQEVVPQSQRLPADPERWKALVRQLAREYAFRELVRQIQQRLEEEPQTVRSLARILVSGTFAENGDTAKASHPQVDDGVVFFRRVEQRWFIENRREESPPSVVPKEPRKGKQAPQNNQRDRQP